MSSIKSQQSRNNSDMDNIFEKYPIFFLSGWYVAFASIVSIPVVVILTVSNPDSQDLWINYLIISIFSSGIWGAVSTFFFIKNDEVASPLKSAMIGVGVAILSLLFLGPFLSLFNTGNYDNSTAGFIAGFGLFPAVLIFVGWIVVPVGMLAGYLLPGFFSNASKKSVLSNAIPVSGLIVILFGLLFVFIPKGMLTSTTLQVEEAKWSQCCKWVHGYAHQADMVIELGFFSPDNELRGVHVVYIQPGLVEYLEPHSDKKIDVVLEVKRSFGGVTAYRVLKVQDFELRQTGFYPSQVLSGVIDTNL